MLGSIRYVWKEKLEVSFSEEGKTADLQIAEYWAELKSGSMPSEKGLLN